MFLVYHDLFYILTVIMLKVDAESVLTNPEETGDTKTSIPPWTRSLYLPYPYGSLIVSAVQIHNLLQKSVVLIQRWEKDPFLSHWVEDHQRFQSKSFSDRFHNNTVMTTVW